LSPIGPFGIVRATDRPEDPMVIMTAGRHKQRSRRSSHLQALMLAGLLCLLLLTRTAPCCMPVASSLRTSTQLAWAFPCHPADLAATHQHADLPGPTSADLPVPLPLSDDSSGSTHPGHTLCLLLPGSMLGALLLRHRLSPPHIAHVQFMPWAVAVPPPRLLHASHSHQHAGW
jgi:hypothetical protein